MIFTVAFLNEHILIIHSFNDLILSGPHYFREYSVCGC
jgi:hypothetical protein